MGKKKDVFSPYPESERKIFGPYFDGVDGAYGDPLRIHRLLEKELDGKANYWLALPKTSPDVMEKSQALGRLVEASRVAFDMAPFDKNTGHGATEEDCLNVIQLFVDWMNAKKVSVRNSPTSPADTECGADLTTKPSVGSNLTKTANSNGRPGWSERDI